MHNRGRRRGLQRFAFAKSMRHISGAVTRIVIIGAGFSGSLTALHLLRARGGANLEVVLIEQRASVARGLAYQCWDDNLLLNVPAGNMSALADDPGHFLSYCRTVDPAFGPGSFVSRRIYGDYLEASLAEAVRNTPGRLVAVQDIALALEPGAPDAAWRVQLASGAHLDAEEVVLALGHFPPLPPASIPAAALGACYINDPWDFVALDRLPHDLPVLILGSGHTAIDALFRLTSASNQRKVILLSRRGLTPQGHRFAPTPPLRTGFPEHLARHVPGVRTYLRAVRERAALRMREGGDWRDAINELRAHTPQIWASWPDAERRRFLRHAVAFWDIHRHRLAPSAFQRFEQLQRSGKVRVIAGRVISCAREGSRLEVQYRPRGQAGPESLQVGAIVNCSGPNYDLTRLDLPLVRQMLADGLLLQDPLKLGLEVGANYEVLDARGRAQAHCHYVGPMLKAGLWEAIAAPELRGHTQRLADILLDSLAPQPAPSVPSAPGA